MSLLRLAAMSTTDGSAGPGCEPLADGFLAEPIAAVSSLAFVAAAVAIPIAARLRWWGGATATDLPAFEPVAPPRHVGYALLVAGIGLGSVVQHGPNPSWADFAHDVPLAATLAFVAADAAAGLLGRRRVWWWWALPTLALVPLIAAAPLAADGVQAVIAAIAVALMLGRASSRRPLRRPIGLAVTALTGGGAIGTLSRAGGPLCVPESVWQGHGAWHVLAALALVAIVPALGRR